MSELERVAADIVSMATDIKNRLEALPSPLDTPKAFRPEWALVALYKDAPKGDPEAADPHLWPGGDLHVLQFEQWSRSRHEALKNTLIRDVLGIAPVRYYMRLNRVVRSPHGLAFDAVLCRQVVERIERLRASREADQ